MTFLFFNYISIYMMMQILLIFHMFFVKIYKVERGSMNKSMKKIMLGIVIICFLVILFDLVFFLYKRQKPQDYSNYFDSVNAFSDISDGYIGVGSNNDNDQNYEKAKLTKFDGKMEKVWEKYYNRGYNSTFYNVAVDDDGYVAVGSVQKDKNEKKNHTTSALIVKYDSDGKEQFSRTLQILEKSVFKNVVVLDDGYLVVGQSIYDNSTLGNSSEGGAILIKYDKNGEILFRKNYGGNKSGLYNDLVVDGDYIYAVGKDYGRVGIISKYRLNGEYLSTSTYQYTDTLGFTGITKIDNDFVLVGAKKISEDEFDHDIDGLVVKYNENLEKISEVLYQGDGLERFNVCKKDNKNNLVIVGHSAILNKEKSTKEKNVYRYYGLLAKYKSDLKEVYVEQYGDGNDDYFTDVVPIYERYFVSGYSKYKKQGYFSKFLTYSDAGKMLKVK